jgi:medium-chain acyl-[acyl-carrier-protein] hydrolase
MPKKPKLYVQPTSLTMQLFFLPFAGANLNSYLPLTTELRNDFDCQVIELPGHGSRFGEPLLETVDSMVTFCCNEIVRRRNDESWGLFGHSLGAVLAGFVCTSDTLQNDQPDWLVVTGRAAPGIDVSKTIRHLLPRYELIHDLINLGGLQSELIDHPELLDVVEPILRADFRAIETFQFTTVPRFKIPILVLGGTTDIIQKEQLEAWRSLTSAQSRVVMIEGSHFFLFEHSAEVVGLIQEMSNITT